VPTHPEAKNKKNGHPLGLAIFQNRLVPPSKNLAGYRVLERQV
jgi:hypothetical protein